MSSAKHLSATKHLSVAKHPTTPQHPAKKQAEQPATSKILDQLKLDYSTIRVILLTAFVVLVLLSVPLLFLLRNFVTFDALDNYLKVTDSVRPKILNAISAELNTGYSRNFVFRPSADNSGVDSTMLFYAAPNQIVTLTANANVPQPIKFQLNGCDVGPQGTPNPNEPLHFYDFDLTKDIARCGPGLRDLHSLRIVLPEGPTKSTTLEVNCLVVVKQRVVHEPVKGGAK